MFHAMIRGEHDNRQVPHADLMVIGAPEGLISANTNVQGWCPLILEDGDAPLTVWIVKDGYHSDVAKGWVPNEGELKFELVPYPRGGSDFISHIAYNDGYIPGLHGHFTIRRNVAQTGPDDRMELHTENLRVNGSDPVDFRLGVGQVVQLSDRRGIARSMAIRAFDGESVLYEYWIEEAPRQRRHEGDGDVRGQI